MRIHLSTSGFNNDVQPDLCSLTAFEPASLLLGLSFKTLG